VRAYALPRRAVAQQSLRVVSPPNAVECRVRIAGHLVGISYAPHGFADDPPPGAVQVDAADAPGSFRIAAVR